jgi:hypothetical protein
MMARAVRPSIVVSFWCAAVLAAATGTSRADIPSGDSDRREDADRTHTFQAGANVDTLDYSWREVLPAAIAELERDDWTIQNADSAKRRITTHWKPLRHVLARLFAGDIQAKIVVDLESLRSGQTVVTIRAGLATDRDIGASPVLGAAQKTYRSATDRWLGNVRARLDSAHASGPVGARSAMSSTLAP